jgi:glycosyltransferase involved in cell wall biosynthesis
MKNLVFVTPLPSPFVEAVILRLPDFAPELNVTPIFYGDCSHRPDWGTSEWKGITIDPQHKKLKAELIAVIEKQNPDGILLSGYGSQIQWAARKWAIQNRKPFFMVLSEPPSPVEGLKRIVRRQLIRRFLTSCSGLGCMGPRAVQEYSNIYDGPIAETPYAFDLTPLLQHERPRSIGESGLTFLFSGRITAQRNPLLVLEAFSAVNQQHKETRLIFSGRGPLEDAINARVEKLGLSHAVKWMNDFSGWHDIMNFYRYGDILVSCSNHNTWNLPIQEAMASGLGIIATWTTEAATALLVNDYNGILIQPANLHSLRQAMLRYVENPELAESHGKLSREVVQTIDARKVAERLAGLLNVGLNQY